MSASWDPRVGPWVIDDAEFYELESFPEQIKFLLQYAILAPSSHNAQPWTFHATSEGVEIRADYSRRLAVVDPDDRELMLGLGAAIANLRIAAAHFGFETTILQTRNAETPGMIAFVAFRETSQTDEELRTLFPAIKQRHTNRQPFEHEPVEPEVLERICDIVERYPETLRLIVPHDRERIADLVAGADERLMSASAYRRELAGWVHPGSAGREDGMTFDGLGIGPGGNWVLRHVDVGPVQAKRDRNLIESAAALIVVTAEDDRVALVEAGEIMENLLLTVTREALHYSFFNCLIEVPDLRQQLWALLGTARPPQLLLRVGHARTSPRPMPRRKIDEVVV